MAKWCVGIDLGGTFIKFGLLSDNRRPGGTLQLPTPVGKGPDGVIEQMIAGAQRLMESENLSRDEVLGVGIGAPGPLSVAKGIVYEAPNIPGMKNVPMRDRISAGLGLPAVLENDANAAAFGEYLCGAGAGVSSMVLLTLGTGVGSGIVIDGRVLHGSHEIGAELGHLIIEAGGEQCGCGQRGCLEPYCSATYVAQLATRLIGQEGRESSLSEVIDQKGSIDARDIQLAVRSGDALAREVWDKGMYYLAVGCVSICRIFDPDLIVLAGGMTKAGEDLMGPLMKHFRRTHWSLTELLTRIVISQLGGDAGVIGAAGVAWQALGQA